MRTGGVLALAALVGFVLMTALAVAALTLLARDRARRRAEGPGNAAADLVPRLTDEVRKWQAEAAHWRTTAERLQRELDGRGSS